MKRILLLVVFVVASSSVGWAGACGSASLAVYDTAGFTCSIGPLLFSDFSYSTSSDGGASPPSAAGVTVTPAAFGSELGLQFEGSFAASTQPGPVTQTADGFITYTVACQGCNLTDWLLQMVGGAFGTGTASVAETNSASGQSLFVFASGTNTLLMQSSTLSGVFSATVAMKDIGASSGLNGSASVSSVWNYWSYNNAPEPASVALLGSALLGAGFLLRRFN